MFLHLTPTAPLPLIRCVCIYTWAVSSLFVGPSVQFTSSRNSCYPVSFPLVLLMFTLALFFIFLFYLSVCISSLGVWIICSCFCLSDWTIAMSKTAIDVSVKSLYRIWNYNLLYIEHNLLLGSWIYDVASYFMDCPHVSSVTSGFKEIDIKQPKKWPITFKCRGIQVKTSRKWR